MPVPPRTVKAGKLEVEFDLADYTDPWRADPPETLLLHHGSCRNMEFWRSWVPLLARDYRVLRVNGRGRGATSVPAPDEEYSLDVLVEDTVAVLDALSLRRVIWVGESSGGIIGIGMALKYPDRLSSMILCDTPFKIPNQTSSRWNVGERDFDTALEKHGFRGICRHTLQDRLDLSRASPALQEWYIEAMGSTPEHVARGHHYMSIATNLYARIPEIKMPVLIMAGAESRVAESEQMQAMLSALPNAKLVSFEGYGHGISLLAPERCVAESRAFLDSRPPSARH